MGRKFDEFGALRQRALAQGTGPNGLAREGILIFWHPVPGSRVPGTRHLGARDGGIVVTSTESVAFWYRYMGKGCD